MTLKIASFKQGARASYGIVHTDGIIDCGSRLKEFPDLRSILAAGAVNLIRGLENMDPDIAIDDIQWLPPIPRPDKILCIGINYRAHIKEMGRETPEYPWVFVRFANSIVGHGTPIVRPNASDHFDFEGELAVVIGQGGRHIPAANALAHVAGYTCFNDGSVRDFQNHSSQFTAGKNFTASGSCGPWMVVAEPAIDPNDFSLSTRLNDTVMQAAPVSDLCFDIPALIQYCSTFTELAAGDLIVTGTPGGVGAARKPPVWMRPGDTLEVDIAGVGLLRNTVIAEPED